MSWMDSWSRPNKSSATPPPLYLTDPNAKYCTSCGRIISDRKSHHKTSSKSANGSDGTPSHTQVIKYCSDGCRKRRINPLDKRIDKTILALLEGEEGSGIEKITAKPHSKGGKAKTKKGDSRFQIGTNEIEDIVFDRSGDAARKTEDADDDDADSDGGVVAEVEPEVDEVDPYAVQDKAAMDSTGNKPNPTGPGSAEKREAGQKKADEREAVRRAARRAVVFGFPVEAEMPKDSQQGAEVAKRKCEAVMNGQVVEPSYAKGNWSIRWREQND